MNDRKPHLAPVPPLCAARTEDAAREAQMIGSWKAQAMLFPTQTARWLAARSGCEIEIDSARVIEMPETTDPPAQAVPDEPERPLTDVRASERLADLFISAMQRSAPAGTRLERVDTRAIEREHQARISKLPFPVVFDAQGTAGGKRHHTLIGLALPPASEDGSGMWHDLVGAIPWYLHAFVELALRRGLSRREAERQLNFFTVPVYVWHGSGLLDPEEAGGPSGEDTAVIEQLFGGAFVRRETEAEQSARRERNRELIARRLKRDDARRRSAEHRQRLFGDPMITEEQLRELHVAIDEDAPQHYGLQLQWASTRLWEQDANQLVQSLPLELLGLAMLAAPGPNTREELLDRSLWRLRKLDQRAAFERHLIPLVAMARVWVADDRLAAMVSRFHRRYLDH